MPIESTNIIGDINLVNFIQSKSVKDYDFETVGKFNKTFLEIKLNNSNYIIFNCAINCFSYELLSNEHPQILFDCQNKYLKFWEKYYNSFDTLNHQHFIQLINNKLSTKDIICIKLQQKNNQYYIVEKEPTFILITETQTKLNYDKLSAYVLKEIEGNYQMIKPAIIYPNSISIYFPKCFFVLSKELPKKEITNNIDHLCLYIIWKHGENLKHNLLKNEDVVFINMKDELFQVKEQKSLTEYQNFCQKFYHNEYSIYLSYTISLRSAGSIIAREKRKFSQTKIEREIQFVFKDDNKLYEKTNEEYFQIESQLRKNQCLMAFCEICNYIPNGQEEIMLIDTQRNPYKSINMDTKKTISEEEAIKNAEILLEMEKNEKEKRKIKNSKKKEKKTYEKNLEKTKLLAKKIAQEAKDYSIKLEISRKNKIDLQNQLKNLAKIISQEAKIYYENKILKLDQNHCDINSPEFIRRTIEWNFLEFLPELYTYPKDYLISIFSKKQPDNNPQWAFNLW